MSWFSDTGVSNITQGDARRISLFIARYGLIGVIAGFAAVGFDALVDVVADLAINRVVDPTALVAAPRWPEGAGWLVLALPPLGGLACGLLCYRWAPECMGSGADAVIHAYHHEGGHIRKRVPALKAAASALVLGTGGSAGVEGPVGHIAGGIGAIVGRALRVPPQERQVLMLAGFAAGIGAVFHAPMASAFFAAEVLYHQMDIEHRVLVPSIIASVVAYAVFGALTGWTTPFDASAVAFDSGLELLPYTALALVLVPAGALFVGLYTLTSRHLGRARRIPLWLRPAIGGLGVGLIGLFIPQALGMGDGVVQAALGGGAGIGVLLILALAKMAATSLTAGSGASGGLFAPTLFIGGALGGAIGIATIELFPALGVHPTAFIVVGMAGFFAAVANAPLSTVIMVSELVGSYELIVPTLWVCTLSWLLARRVVIFKEQVPTRFDAPSGLADMMGGVLDRLTVKDALPPSPQPPVTVPPEMPIRALVGVFANTAQSVFPIIGRNGRLRGVVDGRQLRKTLGETTVDALLIADDFESPAVSVRASDDLRKVVSMMTQGGMDELLVVDDQDTDKLVGLVSRRGVVSAYHRKMLDLGLDDLPSPPDHAPQPHVPPADADETTLYAAVKRGAILAPVEGTDPREVLAHMLASADLPPSVDKDALLTILLERETLCSTAIGGGVAVPHPHGGVLDGFGPPAAIIGLPRHPVAWDAPDGAAVHTVCILLSSGGGTHLTLLRDVARSFSDQRLRDLVEHRADHALILDRLHELTAS